MHWNYSPNRPSVIVMTRTPITQPGQDDLELLELVRPIAHAAGERLLARYSPDARPAKISDIAGAGHRNEEAAGPGLRQALTAIRPGAAWVEDEQETAPLPKGEWWSVDSVEGNVNHVHGLPEWCVSITLLRDGIPVLTVVRQPVGDLTYSAVRGGGAWLNGRPLTVSAKQDLSTAIVATGQAEAGQQNTYRRIGESITAMLHQALLVRATVPSTFPMLLVATGQNDVFWQYEPVLPGIAAGILLITEAGGTVTRIDGTAWTPGSPDVLVATPALHPSAAKILAAIA
jgi:myo-inositol-1(or 4)-monophosphatase